MRKKFNVSLEIKEVEAFKDGNLLTMSAYLNDCLKKYNKIKKVETMFNYELYKGCDIIVNYKNTNNAEIIEFFNNVSNFEGHATLNSLDTDIGCFTIKGLDNQSISCVNLIVMNIDSNEYEYIDINCLETLTNIK